MKIKPDTFFSSTSSAAELLRHVFPVQAVLHIGPGAGHSAVRFWQDWDVPQAILVEANPEYRESLKEAVAQNNGWLSVSALIGDKETETEFHQASNSRESGIVHPNQWQAIWPNLTETSSARLHQLRLDTLLADTPYESVAKHINWAVIDCMPALPILKGAGKYVEQWDIIRVRVILDGTYNSVPGACLYKITEYLDSFGFRCVALTESHHPAVGEVLFARDWKRVLQLSIEQFKAERVESSQEQERIGQKLIEEHAKIESLEMINSECVSAAEQQKSLVKEQQKKLEQFEIKIESLEMINSECASAAEQHESLVKEQQKKLEQFEIKIESLEMVNSECVSATEQHQSLVKEQEKKLEQFEIDLREARQSAGLATKLIMLREQDLHDLQERYQDSVKNQEKQHQVLAQLEERLRVAANYFHQLSDQQSGGKGNEQNASMSLPSS